ncbi:hypothetical protein BIW11_06617 [Tropilaelaps mercedesae]|uniref:Uncharacterized protein n=1 Tax=Tropilaelaps mercedesae TaxID=418985 RepID=A0A1V9XXH9_9ACAR|nr:hypothetical protein BIW11_06617 [Tropilaelaps mercedesae]
MFYFNARLAEKLEQILFCRRSVGNHENQLVFIQKEVDDLRIELKRQEGLLTAAEAKLEQQRKESAASLLMLRTMCDRVQSTVAADFSRMEETTKYYREAFSVVDCDCIVDAVLDKVNTKPLQKFMARCLASQSTDKER